MENEQNINNSAERYKKIMEGYAPSSFIDRPWPMQNGMYQQYSAFDSEVRCTSGTHCSTIML